ncbi:helix-turn-helix domain-containing protein [Micromonospora echinofusca]|uniref:Helix-turn-helix domain-containing protein n=1 Tax=Micromonospora echinofusca TaxID=47858 RepID=A0ABS3VN10_MICEH|nr:AraC family transcriptional regulator [Micromonospora echinofusca]MBO4205905.1 helix-turn-helix domain-containing protein [Micromonospora echinofusca]
MLPAIGSAILDADDRTAAICRAIAWMRDHLADRLRLDDLARIALFSRYHFHRIFHAMTSVTPAQFLTALRLAEAQRLLVHSALLIRDIGLRVGYDSLGSFHTRFSRLVGSAPGTFRQLARQAHTVRIGDLLAAREPRHRPAGSRLTGPGRGSTDGLLLVQLAAGADRAGSGWLPVTPDGCLPPGVRATGEYRARVVWVRPGATVTEALVDRTPGSFLVGTGFARYRGTGRLDIPVTLREPTDLDPPVLTDVPLRLLAAA